MVFVKTCRSAPDLVFAGEMATTHLHKYHGRKRRGDGLMGYACAMAAPLSIGVENDAARGEWVTMGK